MQTQFGFCLATILIATFPCFIAPTAEDGAALENKGFEFLQLAQTKPAATFDAAKSFAKAASAYERAGRADKSAEVNAYLYWCKKKLTQADFEKLAKSDAETARRMELADKPEPPSSAEGMLERAKDFAIRAPEKHVAIALRFYEVFDRFRGTETALDAQNRCVAEMQLAGEHRLTYPREPIPDPAKLKESETFIRGNYADDYAKTKPEDYENLIAKFHAQLPESDDNPVARYAVLHESLMLAAKVPDLAKIFELSDVISAQFRTDSATVRKSALATIAPSKDSETNKALAAAKTLVDKPDDASANTILGRYLAVKNQWALAVPYLAKSGEPALKKLGAQELAGAADVAAKSALADAWGELGDKESQKEFKRACVEHAAALYKAILPNLPPSAKEKAERRIAAGDAAQAATDSEAVALKQAERREANAAAAENIPAAERLNIDNGTILGGNITANKHLPTGTYRAAGALNWPTKFGTPFTLLIDPGTTITGATFSLNQEGSIEAKGTADSPCIFNSVNFMAEYGTRAAFEYCIFDKCRFEKIGAATSIAAQASTDWSCRNCILDNHIFPHLSVRQYDYRFDECVFNNVIFPPMTYGHDRREKTAIDHYTLAHSQFSHIENCTLIDCTIPPFFAWSIAKSNFYNSRFVGNEAYESATELVVNSNYYSNMTGHFPDTAKHAAVKMIPANAPVATPALPDKCTLPDLQGKLKLLYPEKK